MTEDSLTSRHMLWFYDGRDPRYQGRHACLCGVLLPRAHRDDPKPREAFNAHLEDVCKGT